MLSRTAETVLAELQSQLGHSVLLTPHSPGQTTYSCAKGCFTCTNQPGSIQLL